MDSANLTVNNASLQVKVLKEGFEKNHDISEVFFWQLTIERSEEKMICIYICIYASGVTACYSTDRPKSVRNRCVIEVLVAFFMFSYCFLDFSVGVGAFVKGLSQISSFFFSLFIKCLVSTNTSVVFKLRKFEQWKLSLKCLWYQNVQ